MCLCLKISASGYYDWRDRDPSPECSPDCDRANSMMVSTPTACFANCPTRPMTRVWSLQRHRRESKGC